MIRRTPGQAKRRTFDGPSHRAFALVHSLLFALLKSKRDATPVTRRVVHAVQPRTAKAAVGFMTETSPTHIRLMPSGSFAEDGKSVTHSNHLHPEPP